MHTNRRFAALVSGVGVFVGAVLMLNGAAAQADEPDAATTIRFVDSAPLTTGFGSDWNVHVRIETANRPVGAQDGFVDVTVVGIAGIWADHLPISGDGDVYVSPPHGKASLSAGRHQLTAFFRPAAGSNLAASHTTKAGVVTVSALTSTATATLSGVPQLAPELKLSLGGSWQKTTKTSPPGSWAVTVTGPGSKVVFSTTVPQVTSTTDPIDVPITTTLARGRDYTAKSVFTPSADVSRGLTVTQASDLKFHTPDLELAEVAAKPVSVQVVFLVIGVALPIGLAVAIVLVERATRRRRANRGLGDASSE